MKTQSSNPKNVIFEPNLKALKSFKHSIYILTLLFTVCVFAQEDQKQIQIEYAGSFVKDEDKFPGASILDKRNSKQVKLSHEGVEVWADRAVFYKQRNFFRAYGRVRLQQGDTVTMNSDYIEYDGNTKLAMSTEKVRLTTPEHSLVTDTLYFDRNIQQAYYNSNGTVRDSVNVLTSDRGRYYMDFKKYQFLSDVEIVNPEYTLNSAQLDYYTSTGHAYMYGPSDIIGKDYDIYCERGFYDTKTDNGFFVKNSTINYDNRKIQGDSLYFDKPKSFASATNNIKVTDTINNSVVKGHYAEVYRAKDSVFITKRAVAINLVEKDSMYIHGDTLMVTGPEDNRIIRGFRNVKFYKLDMSGKCDSIHVNQKTGLTKMITEPIMWSGRNQMTGDTIHLISNVKTEKLDSLKVINNAFIVSKDTLSDDGYNQVKGKNLYGKFQDNELREVDVIKNTEVIYYMYTEDVPPQLIGIDKTICSKINMVIEENQIRDITFFTRPDGDIFREEDLPKNARRLRGFIWRGDEMIENKDDIFDEDDNNIQLVKIRGVEEPFDLDEEEFLKKQEEQQDPSKQLPKKKKPKPAATIDKKKLVKAQDKQ